METLAFAAAALAAAAPAPAQDDGNAATAPPAAFEVSGDFSLMSDYRFRGISRSDEDPSAEAGLMVRHESGLYAGARGTILRGRDGFRARNPALRDQGDAEIDLYAGYRTGLGGGFDIDGGLMYYSFAGADGPGDYAEPYASLSYLIGPAQLTAGAKYAPSQAGTGREDMLYLYGQLDVGVPFRPLSFSASAGRQDWGPYGSYWTWSAGARYHLRISGLPGSEIGLSYVDTDLPGLAGQDAGLRLALEFTF